MKKIFIISGIIFVVASLFLVINKFFYNSSDKPNITTSIEAELNNKEGFVNEFLYKISEDKAIGLFIDNNKEKIKHLSILTGELIEMDLDGKNKKNISNEKFKDIQEVIWSPSGEKVILKSVNEYIYYDLLEKEIKSLKTDVDSISWNSEGDKIIYKYYDKQSGQRSVNISDPSGDNWKKIEDTNFRYLKIKSIPDTEIITYWNKPSLSEETSLRINTIQGGQEEEIFSAKYGADYKWSHDGKKAVVSFSSNENGDSVNTGIISVDGEYYDLGIPTIAEKTAWSLDDKTLYFALPSIPPGSKMPNDYQDGKISTIDTFWKVNTENGEKKRLIDLNLINIEIDSSELIASPNGRSLFFVNKKDGFIYRIDF